MSTFGSLSTAMSGLNAARAGLDVTGQNMANVNTTGYTRQRVETSAVAPLSSLQNTPGQGVKIDSITRLGSTHLDARVADALGAHGLKTLRAETLQALETIHAEPGDDAISGRLDAFWSAWQDLANRPGEDAPAGVVLTEASVLAEQIAGGYRQVADLWSQTRTELTARVGEVNDLATQVADLNDRIRHANHTGVSPNELLDQRGRLTDQLARLTGATLQHAADGTVNVLVGGNALVDGDRARALTVSGPVQMPTEPTAPGVVVAWEHNGISANLSAGELAGSVDILAPWGELSQAADTYNTLAGQLASDVNAIYADAADPDGATGHEFFALSPTAPPALGLTVAVGDASDLLAGAPGMGGKDGSIADRIAQLGTDGPSQTWSDAVVALGVASASAQQQASLADTTLVGAQSAHAAHSSVSLDEESVNLLSYQRAYQAASRAITAVDEMLETLINRTGRVGL